MNEKNLLMPAVGDVAPRLSPFSNLKDRRFDVAERDYSSSDDASPSRRPRTPKVKSPLIFSGNRMHESQKGLVLQNRDSGRVDGGGGLFYKYFINDTADKLMLFIRVLISK